MRCRARAGDASATSRVRAVRPAVGEVLFDLPLRLGIGERVVLRASPAPHVVVEGQRADGDELAAGEQRQPPGEGERVAAALAAVDADDDGLEHGTPPFGLMVQAEAAASSRARSVCTARPAMPGP